jgi:hypothetical protein
MNAVNFPKDRRRKWRYSSSWRSEVLLVLIALFIRHPLYAQAPWPSDPSRLTLGIRETLFSSRWGKIPGDIEIEEAKERVTKSVLLADPHSTATRPDGSVIVTKRSLLDTRVAKKHSLYLKPGEVGFGVNQVFVIATYESTEEVNAPNEPARINKETYRSVFRLLAEGNDRDRFSFQFELSESGTAPVSVLDEVYADRWYDFSNVSVESTPRPIIPTIETAPSPPFPTTTNTESEPKSPILPTAVSVTRWWDGVPRYVGWHSIAAGSPEAHALGIESPTGAVVSSVNPGSPAEKAGLQRGDLIVAFQGREIDTPEDLEALILQCDVGSRQTIRFDRSSKFITLDGEFLIEQYRRDRKQYGEYAHPTAGWSIRLPSDWKLEPYAKRNELSGKVYDSIKSPNGNYQFHLYHDALSVGNTNTAFAEFVAEARSRFGDHHVGRVTLGKIPMVFVAGPVGETERRILLRIAMIVEGKLCKVDVLAHPLAAFESLPIPVTCILGSLNNQPLNR